MRFLQTIKGGGGMQGRTGHEEIVMNRSERAKKQELSRQFRGEIFTLSRRRTSLANRQRDAVYSPACMQAAIHVPPLSIFLIF